MDKLIAQTQQQHLLIFGQSLDIQADMDGVLGLLRSGQADLICIVEWEPEVFHSILLKFWQQERISNFYNPQRPVASPAGSVLVGNGPLRRAEEDGLESLSEDEFRELLASGCCLVPAP